MLPGQHGLTNQDAIAIITLRPTGGATKSAATCANLTGKPRKKWTRESTDRTADALAAEALKEVRQVINSDRSVDPGPASLELAVRAAYPLVVSGRLTADRGTANNDQPDRRNPGEVIGHFLYSDLVCSQRRDDRLHQCVSHDAPPLGDFIEIEHGPVKYYRWPSVRPGSCGADAGGESTRAFAGFATLGSQLSIRCWRISEHAC